MDMVKAFKNNEKIILPIAAAVGLFLIATRTNGNNNPPTTTPPSNGQPPNPSGAARGLRNNNVGNLKISFSQWIGKIPISQNTDGVFEQFYQKLHGDRAMIKLIKNYIQGNTSHGYLNTLKKVIFKYTATDQTAYLNYVSSRTGITPHQILHGSYAELSKIIPAMAFFENGTEAMTQSEFLNAWQLAADTAGAIGSVSNLITSQTAYFKPYQIEPFAENGKTDPRLRKAYGKSGAYLIKNRAGTIVYVGHSKSNLYRTILRHFQDWSSSDQYRASYDPFDKHEIKILYSKKKDAEKIECHYQTKHQPKDNRQLCIDFSSVPF